ncbi:MAG: nuclear transport factor 2 family protein [Myxococcota bacterium]|nr:nuclear transport factor 2 family protein [Myxococcota bacterium]
MNEIEQLVESEKIKKLKARYMRCLDAKEWEELATCFAEDATSSYDAGNYSFEGRDAIMKFLTDSMGSPRFISMHHVHTPEIELLSDTEARGTWYLEDRVVVLDQGWGLEGTGIYSDQYVKCDGEWRIRHTGYERIFEMSERFGEDHAKKFKTRFDAPKGE